MRDRKFVNLYFEFLRRRERDERSMWDHTLRQIFVSPDDDSAS